MESSRENVYAWNLHAPQNIYLRSCGEFTLVPPDTEKFRTVDFGEIFWPISGRCSFWMGEKKYTLKPGHVWYYPPGSFHQYRPQSTFHYCWLAIAGHNAATLFEALGIVPGLNRAGNCPLQLFTLLGYDHKPNAVPHRISAMSTAFRILLHLSYPSFPGFNGKIPSLDEIKNFIDTSYGSPDLNIGTLAANLGIHSGSLSRAFHKKFGMTFSEYVMHIRIQRAAFMLEKSVMPVKEIAGSCGFNSANYFSKAFRSRTGTSPLEFREKSKSKGSPKA